MLSYDKKTLHREAKELRFSRDTLEKVHRLSDVLVFIHENHGDIVALKGGTAINLQAGLPRLSVDIDLDFSVPANRNEMLEAREAFNKSLNQFMTENGYSLSDKTKNHYALDSLVYTYTNAGGTKDKIKVETNYMLREHILPLRTMEYSLPLIQEKRQITSLAMEEVYAMKLVAMLNRSAARDLYDIWQLSRTEHKLDLKKMKRCFMFYEAISTPEPPVTIKCETIDQLTDRDIRTDLLPVISSGSHFSLEDARTEVKRFVQPFLQIGHPEKEFFDDFRRGVYSPEKILLPEEAARVKTHPMALWKCTNNQKVISEANEKPSIDALLSKAEQTTRAEQQDKQHAISKPFNAFPGE